MGLKQDVEASLKDCKLTKIKGQPCDDDLNKLERELSKIAASIPTMNGGGMHGHIGMIIDDTEYNTFSQGGAQLLRPTNPSAYPSVVNNDAVICECQVAEHKAELAGFETYLGVENAIRKLIEETINKEWLEALKDKRRGLTNVSPFTNTHSPPKCRWNTQLHGRITTLSQTHESLGCHRKPCNQICT